MDMLGLTLIFIDIHLSCVKPEASFSGLTNSINKHYLLSWLNRKIKLIIKGAFIEPAFRLFGLYTHFNTICCQYLILQIECEGASLTQSFVRVVLSLSSLNILFIK